LDCSGFPGRARESQREPERASEREPERARESQRESRESEPERAREKERKREQALRAGSAAAVRRWLFFSQ